MGLPFPPSRHMARALDQARAAALAGEVPVGAVLVSADGEMLAEAHNLTRTLPDPTAHAEMLVLRAAALRMGSERLIGCTLFVTLEPCPMCAAAISEARVARLVFGASDQKGGGVINGPRIFAHSRHVPEVIGGIGEMESAELLQAFFRDRR